MNQRLAGGVGEYRDGTGQFRPADDPPPVVFLMGIVYHVLHRLPAVYLDLAAWVYIEGRSVASWANPVVLEYENPYQARKDYKRRLDGYIAAAWDLTLDRTAADRLAADLRATDCFDGPAFQRFLAFSANSW